MPYSKDFCAGCNRLRVSSVGKLHLCLFGDNGVELRDLLSDDSQQEALQLRIRQALTGKAATHRLHEGNAGMTPILPPSAAECSPSEQNSHRLISNPHIGVIYLAPFLPCCAKGLIQRNNPPVYLPGGISLDL